MSGANSTDNFTAVEVAGHAHRLAHHPAHIEPKPRGIAASRASIEEELTELKARLENPECRDREEVLAEIKQTEKVLKIIGEALAGSRAHMELLEALPIAHEDA